MPRNLQLPHVFLWCPSPDLEHGYISAHTNCRAVPFPSCMQTSPLNNPTTEPPGQSKPTRRAIKAREQQQSLNRRMVDVARWLLHAVEKKEEAYDEGR